MSKLNVVIADDDAFQRNLLKKQWQKISDDHLITASSGDEALAVIQRYLDEIDIVISDLNMPGMDGIEFIRILSEAEHFPHLILISGEKDDVLSSVKSMAFHYGFLAVDALQKPINVNDLAASRIDFENNVCLTKKMTKELVIDEKSVISGIDQQEFCLHYQPLINTQSKAVVGMETLVRWQHPLYGLVMPDSFLPQIENTCMMLKLTKFIISKAIETCAYWHRLGFPLSISINVTPNDLTHVDLVSYIEEKLKQFGLRSGYLTLEITESNLSQDTGKTLDSMARLRLKGINIAIDDFGTGHSSLIQLIDAPFTELKIDKSFIDRMFCERKSLAVVKASILLANSVKFNLVAEGIETLEQVTFLEKLGCHHLQGYYFSKPLPEVLIIEYLHANCDQTKYNHG